MEKEVFKNRIYDCFEDVIKELRWQIDYNISEGIYDHCNEVPAYADVKAVLYRILETAPNIVGEPSMPSSIKRFKQVKKLVRFNFFHS